MAPIHFERFGRFVLRHRIFVMVSVTLLTLAMGYQVMRTPLMTNLQELLPDDTPQALAYDQDRLRFGADEVVLLGLESDDHFTEEGLKRLKKLTRAMQRHPFIERADSLATGSAVWQDPDDPMTIRTEPYVGGSRSPEEVRKRVMADRLTQEAYVSKDGKMMIVQLRLIAANERTAQLPRIQELIKDLDVKGNLSDVQKLINMRQSMLPTLFEFTEGAGYANEKTHIIGLPAWTHYLVEATNRNLRVLFPISGLVVFLTLALLFRSFVGSILPLICIAPAVVWSVGLGSLVFGKLSIVTSAAPIIVLVVGTSDVVHLVTQFRHELRRGLSREDAIIVSLRNVGAACVLTSITTFVGFGAMIFLPLPFTRELGVFAAFGVVSAFGLAFVLTPVMLSFTRSTSERKYETKSLWIRPLLGFFARTVNKRPRTLVLAGLVLTLSAVVLVPQINVENTLANKLPESHRMRQDLETIQSSIGAASDFEILIDAGREGVLKEPATLRALHEFQQRVNQDPWVVSSLGYVDLVLRGYEILAPEQAAEDPIPTSRAAVAEVLEVWLSSFNGIENLVSGDRRHARIIARVPNGSAEEFLSLTTRVDTWAKEMLPEGISARSGGVNHLVASVAPMTFKISLQGLLTASILIAILMGFLFRSISVAVVSLIPNILPVALAVVTVNFILGEVDADALTVMAICLCIAVDDTIHFLARYRIERGLGFNRDEAVERTIFECGYGIIRTSVTLVSGFAVMLFADYITLVMFSVMFSVTLASAVFLDLTLLPALAKMGVIEPRIHTVNPEKEDA